MIKHLCFLLSFGALATPALAAAQDTTRIDPSVSSVVSGGYWQHGPRGGRYRIIVRTADFEHVSSTVRVEWILIRNGSAKTFRFHFTIYSGQELKDRLASAGFINVKLYGNFEGDEYGPGTKRLIAVAEKPIVKRDA